MVSTTARTEVKCPSVNFYKTRFHISKPSWTLVVRKRGKVGLRRWSYLKRQPNCLRFSHLPNELRPYFAWDASTELMCSLSPSVFFLSKSFVWWFGSVLGGVFLYRLPSDPSPLFHWDLLLFLGTAT